MENRKFFQRAKAALRQMPGIRVSSGVSDQSSSNEEEKKIEIPEEFICPISQEIMKDPVKTSDNYTYEREVIEEWLKLHDTSPLTNEILKDKKLEPNAELKKFIRCCLI